jgi:hypothetical protein
VPLTEETTGEGQGSLRFEAIQRCLVLEHLVARGRCWAPCDIMWTGGESLAITRS